MPPRLVICRCDPAWGPTYAVCDTCEHRELERVLERRGLVAREHPAHAAFDALADSYRRDHDDREWERADNHMAERGGR